MQWNGLSAEKSEAGGSPHLWVWSPKTEGMSYSQVKWVHVTRVFFTYSICVLPVLYRQDTWRIVWQNNRRVVLFEEYYCHACTHTIIIFIVIHIFLYWIVCTGTWDHAVQHRKKFFFSSWREIVSLWFTTWERQCSKQEGQDNKKKNNINVDVFVLTMSSGRL